MWNKSFTLIETIVAIFILTTGILALSSLISYFISTSSISSQRLVAAYLAQEGIEIVRNIRDSAYISGDASNWNNVTSTCSAGCSNFDYRSSKIPDNENCSGKNFLNLVGNFYQCSDFSPIQLQRTVTTTQIFNPNGVKVKVEVTWRERGRLHSLKAEENFYNWRE
jgi:Tfp pilus assembly protein PilV